MSEKELELIKLAVSMAASVSFTFTTADQMLEAVKKNYMELKGLIGG